jgi:hypothetical protein
MEYLVCQFKDDLSLFITTRKSREMMLNVFNSLNEEIESVVLKSFTNYTLADKYKKEIEQVNKKIDSL